MVSHKRHKRFLIVKLMILKVFTDGAAKGNGKTSAVGGIGVFFPSYPMLNYSEKVTSDTFNKPVTNNLVELYAIKKAIEIVLSQFTEFKLHIFTDSKYCYSIFTSWAKGWKANGWKKADKKPILNLELIKKIHKYVEKYDIQFSHCNSHLKAPSNQSSKEYEIWYGNDQADKLSNEKIYL